MILDLLGLRVLPDESPVLEEMRLSDWQSMFEPLGGEWLSLNGALVGRERGNKGGILLTRRSFDGDVMIRCRIRALPPATRDLNVIYNAQWDAETNYLKSGYISGLNGWYDHKAGIERFPENGLNVTTPLYHYQPGREVDLIAGLAQGRHFLAVDGQLLLEMTDPHPLEGGRLGFSPYCTQLAVSACRILQVKSEPRQQSYEPEF